LKIFFRKIWKTSLVFLTRAEVIADLGFPLDDFFIIFVSHFDSLIFFFVKNKFLVSIKKKNFFLRKFLRRKHNCGKISFSQPVADFSIGEKNSLNKNNFYFFQEGSLVKNFSLEISKKKRRKNFRILFAINCIVFRTESLKIIF